MRSSAEILAGIEDSVNRAYKAHHLLCFGHDVDTRECEDDITFFVERAFLDTLAFLEVRGMTRSYAAVEALREVAKQEYSKSALESYGEPYLVWPRQLELHLHAIENVLGEPSGGTISKDIVDILRETQSCITDPCFGGAPTSEQDVHHRIEAVLRCVFPDLQRKPAIPKGIKNFHPDTGLPSIKTLIEYKFITRTSDLGQIADEILADSRGYLSPEWDTVLYVVYETHRIKTEKAWNDMARKAGLGARTKVIVIHGEPRSGGGNAERQRNQNARVPRRKRQPSSPQ